VWGEAPEELPALRAAFHRGELSFYRLRALTRVATPVCEQRLLDLARALTAAQLERALRVFRRLRAEQARTSHELEYVDYYWDEDGSLILRARLSAEDGTQLVRPLEDARERVHARRRAERQSSAEPPDATAAAFEPARALKVEALIELSQRALAEPIETGEPEQARLVVHIDAAALTADATGRCELEDGPVIAPETARRLGCDAEHTTSIERDGLPVSVGRTRRTVPPRLRRLLQARDHDRCRWPGCDNKRHLAAHDRTHWTHGGETSLDNLILLSWQHHRLVHEGGPAGELRFRNRHGLLHPTIPRPPPGSADELVAQNGEAGLTITHKTNQNGYGDRMDLDDTIYALVNIIR